MRPFAETHGRTRAAMRSFVYRLRWYYTGLRRCYRGRPPNPYPKVVHREFLFCWKGLVKTSGSVEKNNLFGNNYYLKNVLKVWFSTCSRLNDTLLVWYDVVTWVERWTYDCELSNGCVSHPVIGILFSVLIYRAGEEQGCGTMHWTIMVSADLFISTFIYF